MDGWRAEAGATLCLELEVATPMVACRVLSSAPISLEVECEVRRDLAISIRSGRYSPPSLDESGGGGGGGGGDCGGAWVCVAVRAVRAGEEASLQWADAGAHLRWRLRVASVRVRVRVRVRVTVSVGGRFRVRVRDRVT